MACSWVPILQIISATRQSGDPTNVDIVHVVEENGQLLTGGQATEQLNLLSDQELAIQLGHVVGFPAKPYVQEEVTTSAPKTEDESSNTKTLIIIGSVVGATIFGIVLIIVLCICCWGNKCCCKRKSADYEDDDDDDDEEGGTVRIGTAGKQRARGGKVVISDIVQEVKVIDGDGK
ncbi:mucin-19-like isoform X3, partial [Elysia marginata]